jgi:predicted nucleotidyltransferase
MVTAEAIITFVDAIASATSPGKVLLFGSYANGLPTDDSDVDLLVVKEFRGRAEPEATRLRIALPEPFAMDLLVRRQSDIDRRITWNDFFLRDIMENGLLLYAANNSRMGEQGRRRLRRRLAAPAIPQANPA